MKKYGLVLLFAFLLVGCTAGFMGGSGSSQGTTLSRDSSSKLEGKEFKLENKLKGNNLTLGFDIGNRIYGYSGHNRFFGRYKLLGGKDIDFVKIIPTEKKLTREKMLVEVEYLTLLKNSTGYKLDGDRLILKTPKGTEMIFNRIN